MTELLTWLRAQLDEDEAVVRRNLGGSGLGDDGTFPDSRTYDGVDVNAADDYLSRFNPPRLLAEVEAKRRILNLLAVDLHLAQRMADLLEAEAGPSADLAQQTLRLLVLPYAHRPGYREEWRP